jgi:hypothetical protein
VDAGRASQDRPSAALFAKLHGDWFTTSRRVQNSIGRETVKGSISLQAVDTPYPESAFSRDITNVNASEYFTGGGWIEGAHSEFWQTETMHLIASLVEQVR